MLKLRLVPTVLQIPRRKQTTFFKSFKRNKTIPSHPKNSRMNGTEKVKVAESCPPEGAKVLDTQVGGHRYGENGRKMGMLDRGNGIVLKALQGPPRGTRELELYQTVFARDCKDRDLLQLRDFLPHYYGTEVVDDVSFLVMGNLVHDFPNPNVLDLKMGRITYDPEATEEKKLQEDSKYPPLKDLGFQFTGMMMHDPVTKAAQHFSKEYCRKITAETMLTDGLGKFFGLRQPSGLRKDVLSELLVKLRQIDSWFRVQRKYAFYASSLLIIYSSKQPGDSSSAEGTVTQKLSPFTEEKAKQNLVLPSDEGKSSDGKESERSVNTISLNKKEPSVPLFQNKASPVAVNNESYADGGSMTDHPTISAENPQNSAKEHVSSAVGSSPSCATDSAKESPASDVDVPTPASHKRNCSSVAESGSKCADHEFGPTFRSKHAKSDSRHSEIASATGVLENEAKEVGEEEGGGLQTTAFDCPIVEVRMIDFAHVFPSTGKPDDNYLFGLERLICRVEQLLEM